MGGRVDVARGRCEEEGSVSFGGFLWRRCVVLRSLTKWSRDEPRNGPQKDLLSVQRLLCLLNVWFGCVL
ncbi:hypothetical protein NC652_006649 [Populus alba x Populus x berolinensis]|nr:hypothetical protein NC652_006649 [Populus alba x Populus x berolinensis]